MKSNLVKVLTLSLFIILILSFVVYRMDFFGTEDKPNNKTNKATTEVDSIFKDIDSTELIQIMSSSKSLILIDDINTKPSTQIDSTDKLDPIIYSSKSSIILEPSDFKKLKLDSISKDSTQNK